MEPAVGVFHGPAGLRDFGSSARQPKASIVGSGLSVSSLWNAVHEIRAGRLIRVLPDWRLNDQAVLWLVYPRADVLTPKTRLFTDFLIERVGNRAERR